MTIEDTKRIIGIYNSVFNGLYTRNQKFNVPETSSSLGLIETTGNTVKSVFMVRSPYDNAQRKLANRIVQTFLIAGAKAQADNFTPGWLPLQDDILTKIYCDTCKRLFKKDPVIGICSGGVEPSFILPNVKGMSGISVGPSMENVHSKDERLNVESVNRFYKTLGALLKNIH
jgi:dipeptidase D